MPPPRQSTAYRLLSSSFFTRLETTLVETRDAGGGGRFIGVPWLGGALFAVTQGSTRGGKGFERGRFCFSFSAGFPERGVYLYGFPSKGGIFISRLRLGPRTGWGGGRSFILHAPIVG